MKKSLFLSLLLCQGAFTNAQNTAFDVTFGTNGRSNFGLTGTYVVNAVQIDMNGKTISGGLASVSGNTDFLLSRVDSAGLPDNTFGTNGIVKINVSGTSYDVFTSLSLQPDGKIVAGGYSNAGGDFAFAVYRFNNDGTPDAGFGTAGMVSTAVGTRSRANALLLQPDGKIVAGGWTYTGTKYNIALVRYNTDGTPDNSFGTLGTVTVSTGPNSPDSVISMALQADGKIVTAGDGIEEVVIRYNTDGTLDSTFGSGGISLTSVIANAGQVISPRCVVIQPDGKIITACRLGVTTNVMVRTRRYKVNGTTDSTFGTNGIYSTRFAQDPTSTSATPYAMVLRPDGRILIGGSSYFSGGALGLLQLKATGQPDSTFGLNGKVTNVYVSGVPSNLTIVKALALLPDGRMVAGTENYTSTGPTLVRYRATGNGGSPLPVTLLAFRAYGVQTTARLEWQTAMEKNSDYFGIERSVDGRHYMPVARVKAAGNSNSPQNYSYSDDGLMPGKYYYRLRLTDADGSFTYSEVATVNISGDKTITIFPNPADHRQGITISLQSDVATSGTMSIIGSDGKEVRKSDYSFAKGINRFSVETENLSAGIYTISFKGKDGSILFQPKRLVIK